MNSAELGNSLLLSIDEPHVERILSGKKEFELRKSVSRQPFSRVYLFQTRGTGVVGWFETDGVLRSPVKELWAKVGSAATTRARFFNYFANAKNGCAIPVVSFERLDEPVSPAALRRAYPSFSAPMSSHLLRPGHPLADYLAALSTAQARSQPRVRLRPISNRSRRVFRQLVLKEIGKNYDEIDDSFVDGILESHEERHDPVGFFTEYKEALSIHGAKGRIVGFSTITYKRGGSAKTGPTILHEDFRGQGIGQDVRTALEARILRHGFRKVYCTAASSAEGVVRYLLKSGYRIEAHLSRQYSDDHDEIVFGKLLFPDNPELFLPTLGRSGKPARVERIERGAVPERASEIADVLKRAWFPFDESAADRIAEEVCAPSDPETKKPKEALVLVSSGKVIGAVVLLPKRGGSVKALLVSLSSHTPSLERLVDETLRRVEEIRGKKTYFLHPVGDSATLRLFREKLFMPEGLLRAPYAPGQDLVVFSRESDAVTAST